MLISVSMYCELVGANTKRLRPRSDPSIYGHISGTSMGGESLHSWLDERLEAVAMERLEGSVMATGASVR